MHSVWKFYDSKLKENHTNHSKKREMFIYYLKNWARKSRRTRPEKKTHEAAELVNYLCYKYVAWKSGSRNWKISTFCKHKKYYKSTVHIVFIKIVKWKRSNTKWAAKKNCFFFFSLRKMRFSKWNVALFAFHFRFENENKWNSMLF